MSRAQWIFGAILAVVSCGGSPTQPKTDFIELKAISPAAGTILTASSQVTFTATVTCTIVSADGGLVSMFIGNQGLQSLKPDGRGASERLSKGTATVTLTDTVTIPAESGSRVNVMLPIFIDGSNTTSQLKQVTYEVR
jgi:hypothetical protein